MECSSLVRTLAFDAGKGLLQGTISGFLKRKK
jgi:hypothetical protein